VLPLDLKRVFAPDTGGMYEELLKRATTPRIEASLPVAAVAR
jgi:hypothetical protein